MTGRLSRCFFALVAIALMTGNTAFAQKTLDTPQSWIGTLDVGAAKLRLRFDIEKDDSEKLKCTMISIDQGKVKIPMDSCKIDDGKLVIVSKKLRIVFEGTYTNRNTPIKGKYKQSGQSFDLTLKPIDPPEPTKHIETWQGTMKAGGKC